MAVLIHDGTWFKRVDWGNGTYTLHFNSSTVLATKAEIEELKSKL